MKKNIKIHKSLNKFIESSDIACYVSLIYSQENPAIKLCHTKDSIRKLFNMILISET
jgi:hypothetical protein